VDPETILFHTKCTRDPEKVWPWKKSKDSKRSLDPITLMEGNLNDTGDTIGDSITKLL